MLVEHRDARVRFLPVPVRDYTHRVVDVVGARTGVVRLPDLRLFLL